MDRMGWMERMGQMDNISGWLGWADGQDGMDGWNGMSYDLMSDGPFYNEHRLLYKNNLT